jgi:transcriptional regulator with XRE-family HTH domain
MMPPAVNLTKERRNRGLSKAAAARAAGVAPSVWGRAEAGEPMSARNAFKIARFLGYEVTDIWPIDDTETAAA